MIKSGSFLSLFFSGSLAILSCGKDSNEDPAGNAVDTTPPDSGKSTWWKPVTGVSFDWQLDDIGTNDTFSAQIVDVDAFTTSAETVAKLHSQGKKVIAYFSAGTIEADRPDAGLLPKEIVGKTYPEWPDEKWLDIRQIDKLTPWLNSRFNMIIRKGFDGIERDNMDSYDNETGFGIRIPDVKRYAELLIDLAHRNGLSVGQKNIKDLTPDLAEKFDWVLTEEAFQGGWENEVEKYIALNKPVFAVEYTDQMSVSHFERSVCPAAKRLRYTAILKHRDLNKWVDLCN